MKKYIFKIGVKNLELNSTSIEAAYNTARMIKAQFNWKGEILLIN
jgi:hypothetical protein